MEINFNKRESIQQVEESSDLAPKFDENGLIPVVTTDHIFWRSSNARTYERGVI